MKKVVLIILLFLLTTSCSKYIVQNVYEKSYPESQVETMYTEMYYQLKGYEFYIPLDQWIQNKFTADTTAISQYIARKIINDKTNYQFIFTEYTYPSKTYYNFVIRYTGKKK